jgi:hypothetical protein
VQTSIVDTVCCGSGSGSMKKNSAVSQNCINSSKPKKNYVFHFLLCSPYFSPIKKKPKLTFLYAIPAIPRNASQFVTAAFFILINTVHIFISPTIVFHSDCESLFYSQFSCIIAVPHNLLYSNENSTLH